MTRPWLLACLAIAGCSATPPPPPPHAPVVEDLPPLAPAKPPVVRRSMMGIITPQASASSEREAEEHWFFEALSSDGKRALLRQLEPGSRATFHIRVIEVDSGRTLEETRLPELAKIPSSTIGGKPTELAELEWMLVSPAFGRDLVKGARIASGFPFGACGRLAAAANGSAIAFDAGDWLYTADESGRVRRRLVDEAAYDPRFSADGKHFLFRRATGTDGPFAKYELFTMPADLSQPPRVILGTAGVRDRFFPHPDGQSTVAISTQSRGVKAPSGDTCVLSISLKSPFLVKRLACLDGGEQLVDSVVSPKGKWAALSTKKKTDTNNNGAGAGTPNLYGHLEWRLRVVNLATGKVMRDEPDAPGLGIRAISDSGLLVQSGSLGIIVTDVPAKRWRSIDKPIDLGYRGFFRNDKQLVYVDEASVAVIDVSKE